MKVVVAGGSGLIGRALVPHLAAQGDEVVLLSRSAATSVEGARIVAWTPGESGPWTDELRGASAVVNLCGESLGGGRWTARRKQVLLASRLVPTRSLVDAMVALPVEDRPATFVSASGTDVYEGLDLEPATEETPPADSFLARLCLAWEAEATRAEAAGVRVVVTRFAVVIGRGAPSLSRLVLPFRLMVGGRLGSGGQWFSWVAIDDLARMIAWAIADDKVRGTLNVAAPTPLRQREVASAIGRVVGRPSWLPAPAWAIRLALGEMSTLALGSRRVLPAKATALGYTFAVTDVDEALEVALR